jgi:hypothetical protein
MVFFQGKGFYGIIGSSIRLVGMSLNIEMPGSDKVGCIKQGAGKREDVEPVHFQKGVNECSIKKTP